MTLDNFLDLYDGGVATVMVKKGNRIYREEKWTDCEEREELGHWYQEIRTDKVKRFSIIGGNGYPVELYIDLEDEL